MKTRIIETFHAINQHKPLVHNVTNFVVMNNTANALLAIGASPVMAHAKQELEEMVSLAAAVVINMGTLDKRWLKSMQKASKAASKLQKNWVFDPVGAGATEYRTKSAIELIEKNSPTIIRANASEIMALAKLQIMTKGVDSTAGSELALEAAQHLVNQYHSTVVISGETDLILSEGKCTKVHNGNSIMTRVTGMGCTATAITGACLAVTEDAHLAAVTSMAIMGVCGELALQNSTGSGSFQIAFIDALYNLNADQLGEMLRIDHE